MSAWRALVLRLVVCAVALLGARPALAQCVSLTTAGSAATQNFDTLSNTAGSTTNNLTVPGWFLTESGGGARDNEQYAVDTGGSTTGDVYSYGAAASTERALGFLRSGTLIPIIGACFTNNTGSTLTRLDVAYTGEEWRLGTAARTDQVNFEYSTNATDLVTGTWTGVAALNFVTPDTATVGAKNGNAAADRTVLSSSISSVSIANGATFWVRWNDVDATGADDGLAIDDFALTPQTTAPAPALSIDDVTRSEGNTGTTTFTFTVSLSSPAQAGGVTFDIATADGTASSATDYLSRSLTLQAIAAGASTYTFDVTVGADLTYEPAETFFVNVTNVSGATVADAQGLGTITNDDAQPCVDGVTCLGANYCDSSNACVPQRAQGLACNPAVDCKTPGACSECQSGSCVDGVCCDTSCPGTCAACSAARKGGGADGVCGPIASGSDPDDECTQDSAQSCGFDGTCNGGGACARYGTSVACDAPVCVGAESRPRRCDGLGACVTATSGAACGPFVCVSGSGLCATSCAGPLDCASTHYCDAGTSQCAPKIAAGGACTSGPQCTSTFCVDGVCCDTGCAGTCLACSAAKKGQGADGACADIAAGSDPDNECAAESPESCGRTGSCGGAGACGFWSVGTDCAATPGANVCAGNVAVGRVCTAPNTCSNASTGTDCAPQRCVAGACAPCVSAADCADPTTHFCDGAGVCQPKLAQGVACGATGQCTSGNCVDGVCCESACSGACEWCADPANPGTCRAAPAGAPRSGRACGDGGAGGGTACAEACDGQTRGSCVYPTATTTCEATRCSGDALVGPGACNGAGLCAPGATTDCGDYTCDVAIASCRTSCAQDADCQAGFVCNTSAGTCATPATDAGAPDAGAGDAGAGDAGAGDAGAGDAGAGDAGAGDASVADAGDAELPDAGLLADAGARDANAEPRDASIADAAGARPDATVDGGTTDGGTDVSGEATCACRAAGRPSSNGAAALVLLAVGAARRRARRRGIPVVRPAPPAARDDVRGGTVE